MVDSEAEKGPETKSEFLEVQEQKEKNQKEEMQRVQQELEQLENVPEGTPLHQEVENKAYEISQQRQTQGEPGTPEQDFLKAIDQTKTEKQQALESLEGQKEPAQASEAPIQETKSVPDSPQTETEPIIEGAAEPEKDQQSQQPEQEPVAETKETFKSIQQAIQEAETAITASGLEVLEQKKQELTALKERILILEKEIPELEQKTSGELEKIALSFVLNVPELRLCYKRRSRGNWRLKDLAAAKIIYQSIKNESLREAILGLKDLAKGVKTRYSREFGGKLEQRAAKKERKSENRKLSRQRPVEVSA